VDSKTETEGKNSSTAHGEAGSALMAVFADGPADKQRLPLFEAPLHLRVTQLNGQWIIVDDSLPLVETTGTIYAYKTEGEPGSNRVRIHRERKTGSLIVPYQVLKEQPAQADMRDSAQWRFWRWRHDLLETPWAWDFFEALREIERAFPDKPRVGTSKILADDPVRFGQFVSLAFATSTLEQAHAETMPERESDDRPLRPTKLPVRFLGLTGPNGPLPLVLTEFIRNRLTGVDDPDQPRTFFGEGADQPQVVRRDPALAEFIDIFHHRLISLFYRAWALANQAVDSDRHRFPLDELHFSRWLASLFGHGLKEYEGLDSVPTWQKIAFAGFFANDTRHLAGLCGLLTAAFQTRVQTTPLVGQWVQIPHKERWRLGETPRTATLGNSCVVGSCFWDRQQKFSVRLGPMPFSEFVRFFPGAPARRCLEDWIANYMRRAFAWKAVIVLHREEVPPFCLGVPNALGRTTWLCRRTSDNEAAARRDGHEPPIPRLFPRDPEDYHITSR
jgi:type VI secretion system protein ImpH